jgi:RimJ/RimL family protein N-acetyltransferase
MIPFPTTEVEFFIGRISMEQDIYQNYYWQDDKIRLRLWQPKDDASSMLIDHDIIGQSSVGEEMQLPPEIKDCGTDKASAKQNPGAPSFTIETLSGEFVGHIHFNYINERHGTFSVGLILCPSKRGMGYGTSALNMLLRYAFRERRLNKFSGFCLDNNAVSIGMMKKLGCKQEGTVREEVFINGRYHDRLLFGLTATEYNEMRNSK